ncbi:MAG: methyltransferase domain-containing protein [Nitrospirae bacterium]|nr:MAG: methyltransferase domain-containing protein [Nitrospirota bacterium]
MDAAKVERVYSSYAKVYDQIFGKIFHDGREHAVRHLALAPGERVLEVGVGTGLSLLFYPPSCEIVGIDLSDGMLAQCRERVRELGLKQVSLVRMDAGAMEFADDSFDAVMAAYVMTAVPDYRKVILEMIRVCKPGGRIILLNHFSNGNPVIAALEKFISPLCKQLGWRTDLSLATVLDGTLLTVIHKQKVNPLRFWHLVKCLNQKLPAEKTANGNGHSS